MRQQGLGRKFCISENGARRDRLGMFTASFIKSEPRPHREQPPRARQESAQQHEAEAGRVPPGTPWQKGAPTSSRNINEKDSLH